MKKGTLTQTTYDYSLVATVNSHEVYKANEPTCSMGDIIKTITNKDGFKIEDLTLEKYQELYTGNFSWYKDFIAMTKVVLSDMNKKDKLVRIGINYDYFRDEEMYIYDVKPFNKSFTKTYIGLYAVRYKTVL